MGTFTGARKYVLQTFATTESPTMKKRVARYMISTDCPLCHGKRLRPEALAVTFAGLDIADLSRLPLKRSPRCCGRSADGTRAQRTKIAKRASREEPSWRSASPRTCSRASRCCSTSASATSRLDRSTPTLSPGELQRLRLATQVRSNLFGVVYVLDEPSAGLHPADTRGAPRARSSSSRPPGNSLFVVEHELDVMRARRLDRRRRARRRRARRPRPLQRPARRAANGRGIAHRALPLRRARASPRRGRRATSRGWLDSKASRATTCTASTSASRSAS